MPVHDALSMLMQKRDATMTMPRTSDNLLTLRAQLDDIDNRIASLLDQRFSLVTQVGIYKRTNTDQPLTDPMREQEIYARLSTSYTLHAQQICTVYRRIFDVSKQMQQDILQGNTCSPAHQIGLQTSDRATTSVDEAFNPSDTTQDGRRS